MSNPRPDLTTADAAKELGLTTRHVHRLVEAGTLVPAVRFPGLRGPMMFKARDVERLAARRAKAKAS